MFGRLTQVLGNKFIVQKVNAPANSVSHWIFLLFSLLPWALRKLTSADSFRQARLHSGFSWDLASVERQQEIKGRREGDPSSFSASITPAQGVGSGCLAQWKVTAPVRQL